MSYLLFLPPDLHPPQTHLQSITRFLFETAAGLSPFPAEFNGRRLSRLFKDGCPRFLPKPSLLPPHLLLRLISEES